jgi:uncharacterized caspase-like protein
MKKLFVVLFLCAAATGLFAQQKYALVIGNANYTHFGSLPNAANDANDVAAALQGLGFSVDKVLDGSRVQMAEAIARLKNRLSVSKDSYGFFFYAGHGVQFNGVNYLIPAKADIPSANYLGDTSISVQTMLAELNDAGNGLNVVVLDACRDFPAAWSRSANRGLAVVAGQPADSIIVYATSAGSTASDGSGRNGLFTSHLLNNLKQPGLEVTELFRRTGADVARASGRAQIPAVYSQFFDTAYLGQRPAANTPVQPAAQTQQAAASAAGDYLERGKAFFGRNDYDAAVRELTEAVRLDPNLDEAYAYRARAYNGKKDYDRAIADYNTAIRLDPNYVFAYNNRGIAYHNKKDYDRAVADYSEAIRLDPNYALAYNNRGFAYYNKKDYDRAVADYEAALRIDPNYAAAKNNLENARRALGR